MNYRHFASAFAELMEVELGLAVNLKTFREVLREVSIDGRNWWLASNVRDAVRTVCVRVGYRDLTGTELLNTIYFRISVVSRAGSIGEEEPSLLDVQCLELHLRSTQVFI